MARAYLDHASTSPIRPAAAAAMRAWLDDPGGDPGRIHAEGMRSRHAVEVAREQVAERFGARPREVVFTSGASEAIAMVGWGVQQSRPGAAVAAPVEHSAVRDWADRQGARSLRVDRTGRIELDDLTAALDDTGDGGGEIAVVHLQWGNHEVGTVQPVAEAAALCRDRGVLLHVDAAQAAGHVAIDFDGSGIDLLSVSGHKFGGPPGTGALLVRRGLRLPPLIVGGDQERARRAGMENLPAVVGLGAAAAALDLDREEQDARALTDQIIAWADAADGVELLGNRGHRLPHIVCLGLRDVEPQPVLLALDQAGVAVQSGSSCSSEAFEPSPVLAAMGVDAERSLRISVGWSSTAGDVDHLLTVLPRALDSLASLGRRER